MSSERALSTAIGTFLLLTTLLASSASATSLEPIEKLSAEDVEALTAAVAEAVDAAGLPAVQVQRWSHHDWTDDKGVDQRSATARLVGTWTSERVERFGQYNCRATGDGPWTCRRSTSRFAAVRWTPAGCDLNQIVATYESPTQDLIFGLSVDLDDAQIVAIADTLSAHWLDVETETIDGPRIERARIVGLGLITLREVEGLGGGDLAITAYTCPRGIEDGGRITADVRVGQADDGAAEVEVVGVRSRTGD